MSFVGRRRFTQGALCGLFVVLVFSFFPTTTWASVQLVQSGASVDSNQFPRTVSFSGGYFGTGGGSGEYTSLRLIDTQPRIKGPYLVVNVNKNDLQAIEQQRRIRGLEQLTVNARCSSDTNSIISIYSGRSYLYSVYNGKCRIVSIGFAQLAPLRPLPTPPPVSSVTCTTKSGVVLQNAQSAHLYKSSTSYSCNREIVSVTCSAATQSQISGLYSSCRYLLLN